MSEQIRIGDIIDDHCTKCGMVTNHTISSIVEEEPARTRCRTCYDDHKYRRAKGGKRKKARSKSDLFDEVLSKIELPG